MEVSVKETGGRKERKLNQVRLIYRIFFNEPCGSDFTIISADDRVFPCHTAILSVECEVFCFMMKVNWIEVTTTRLVLQDVFSEGVDAFLHYMYQKDIQSSSNKFSVAVQMYFVSHKFMLHDLTAQIKKIILGKHKLDWYSDIEACLELYKFTSVIQEERITKRLMRVLKILNHSVENQWKMRDMCHVDPILAVKLFWDSFDVCTCSEDFSAYQFESDDNEYEEQTDSDDETI